MKKTQRRVALATLVAAVLCLPMRETGATPLTQEDVAAATAPTPDTADPLTADDGDDWDQVLSIDVFARSGLPVDSIDEGMHQVARSLEEDDGLQRILRSTAALRTPEPLVGTARYGAASAAAAFALPNGQDERVGLAPEQVPVEPQRTFGAAAAPAPRLPPAAADPVRTAAGTEIAATDGETLRDALRGLVARPGGTSGQAASFARGDGNSGFDLGEDALESRVLGETLNLFVSPTDSADFEPSFSLFGLGRFSIDASGALGSIEISEFSSGLSLSLRDRTNAPSERANTPDLYEIYEAIWSFLVTPAGTLSVIFGTILLVVWGTARMITRRHRSRMTRPRRSRMTRRHRSRFRPSAPRARRSPAGPRAAADDPAATPRE